MPRNRLCQIAAAAAIVFVMTAAVPDARAAATDAASAPAEASAPLAVGSQYTIRPGQSLNDVAIAATQSHDRATLVRASRALFDANPNAFMAHDPSRLRLGAVLTIPALDSTGAAVAASGASAASATAASAATQAGTAGTAGTVATVATVATAATAATPASGAMQAQAGAAAQGNAASAAQQGTPSTANVASEPLPANPATTALASAPSAATASATLADAASSAVGVSSASSAVAASQASGTHQWAGSIQPSASAAASVPVVQAPTQVSSLQQLLALKSRVLMELQKHGIGGGTAVQPSGGATTAATGQAGAVHSMASGSAAANAGMASGHPATDAGMDLSSTNLGIAAAIGAALVALLAGLGMRRRKRAAGAAGAADAAVSARAAAVATPVPSGEGEDKGVEPFAGDRTLVDEAAQDGVVAREANSQEVVQGLAAHEVPGLAATEQATESEASSRAVTAHETSAWEVAGREATAYEAAAHGAPAQEPATSEAAAHEAAAHEAAAHEAAAHEAAAHEAAAHEAAAHEAAAHEAAAHEAAAHEAAAHEAAAHEAATHEPATQDSAPQELPADRASVSDDATSESSAPSSQEFSAYDPDAFPVNRPLEQTAYEPAPEASESTALEHEPANEALGHSSQEATQASEGHGLEIPTESTPDQGAKAVAEASLPQEPPTSAVDSSDSDKLAELSSGEQTADTPTEATAPNAPPSGDDSQQPAIHVDTAKAEPHIEPNHGEAPVGSVTAPVDSPTLRDEDTLAAAESHTKDVEGHWGTPEAFPLPEPLEPFPAELAAPKGFPREAVDAFDGLDFGLPPRIDLGAIEPSLGSLDKHPVVDPEIAAREAIAPLAPAPQHVADEIAAGTAGAGAVAGLGAARFGALNLDFDLELPPSPAQPLPLFTPEDLGKIARNKLDLASEYIELGDLAGARALIHEVIEANDTTTRSEARAMLSTLAPLS